MWLVGEGDTLSVFAGLVPEQAVEIDASPGGLFRATKGRRQGGVKGSEGVDKACNITRGDVADGRRRGRW